MDRIEKRKPGPSRLYRYDINDASEYLKVHSELVILVPSLNDYLHDMTLKAGASRLASPPAFYKYIGGSIDTVAEYSGLDVIGENRVAGLVEGNVPEFVLEKIVHTVGREALLAYLEKTSALPNDAEIE